MDFSGVSKPIFSTSALDNYHSSVVEDIFHPDADDMSGSSSDSQGSIIRASGPYRPPPNKAPRTYSPGGSPKVGRKPTTTVWSPFGQCAHNDSSTMVMSFAVATCSHIHYYITAAWFSHILSFS